MLDRGSSFRLLVTVLLAMAVPFCCCNFHAWFSPFVACYAPSSEVLPAEAPHIHRDGDTHDHAAHNGEAAEPIHDNSHTPRPHPCAPGKDQHDCDCIKSSGRMLTFPKATIEFPAPLMDAVIVWQAITEFLPPTVSGAFQKPPRIVEPPPTSLLRQHCALIV